MMSYHYKKHRRNRENFISRHLGGDGHAIDYFVIDKQDGTGAEIHTITDNGIVIIHNYNSGKMITKLVARKNQILRYYKRAGRERDVPCWLLSLCEWHESLYYNR